MMNRKFKVECELTAGEMAALMSALSAARVNAHNDKVGLEGQSRLWRLICSVSDKVGNSIHDRFFNSLPNSSCALVIGWQERFRKIVKCADYEGKDYAVIVGEKEVA